MHRNRACAVCDGRIGAPRRVGAARVGRSPGGARRAAAGPARLPGFIFHRCGTDAWVGAGRRDRGGVRAPERAALRDALLGWQGALAHYAGHASIMNGALRDELRARGYWSQR